jgi:uncharacterized membrane protein YhdT
METQDKSWQGMMFKVAFAVLTVLVWCPLGYGQYGETGRTFGMPTWAVTALCLGALLFLLEWIYLFMTDLALDDDSLSNIMRELSMLNSNTALNTKEGK